MTVSADALKTAGMERTKNNPADISPADFLYSFSAADGFETWRRLSATSYADSKGALHLETPTLTARLFQTKAMAVDNYCAKKINDGEATAAEVFRGFTRATQRYAQRTSDYQLAARVAGAYLTDTENAGCRPITG